MGWAAAGSGSRVSEWAVTLGHRSGATVVYLVKRRKKRGLGGGVSIRLSRGDDRKRDSDLYIKGKQGYSIPGVRIYSHTEGKR